jgi:hypothetical protein
MGVARFAGRYAFQGAAASTRFGRVRDGVESVCGQGKWNATPLGFLMVDNESWLVSGLT